MIFLILIWSVFESVTSHPPLGNNNCALYLPVEASLYNRHQYFLKNVIGLPGGSEGCITYADVESAFRIASSTRGLDFFPPPGVEWVPEDVKEPGEIVLQISTILAKQYSLDPHAVYTLLPQIDTTKTSIINICPPFAAPLKCNPGRYRRIDGLCNNLQYPTWGATRAVFNRLIPPVYSDGIGSPRTSPYGKYLPNARLVSATIHRDEGFHDHAASLLMVAWGQFMDHDFTLTAIPLDAVNRNEPEECCNRPPALKNPYCDEISIPPEDKFYNLFGAKCIDFVRGFPGVKQDCRLGSRDQFNILTSFIDGNTIYGGTDEAARELRTGYGGLMKMHEAFTTMGLKPILPLKTDIPDEGCVRSDPSQHCFLAGEIRVNEQLILTCMHTIMNREHNRIAKILGELNPFWDDERLYQETRHIVAAEIQHVTYNEFLPQLLGHSTMKEFGLLLNKEGYWDGYDPTCNPSMTAAFVTSAFRFGHSLLPSTVERWSNTHKYVGSKRLSTLIRQPFDLYRAGFMDEYLLGMSNQPVQAMDDAITQEVTNHLFQENHERFGVDLVAFNIQRGREFGVPGYNAYRKFCGLQPARDFSDLAVFMTNYTAARYASIYTHVDDIDLWSGGVSERPKPGSLLGPTFSCIIAHQMLRVRKGDRYWYELPNQPSSFSKAQLKALKRVQFARILCDNTDKMETMQIYPLVLADHEINPRVPCKSGIIPHLDLRPWKDAPANPEPVYSTLVNEPRDPFQFFPYS